MAVIDRIDVFPYTRCQLANAPAATRAKTMVACGGDRYKINDKIGFLSRSGSGSASIVSGTDVAPWPTCQ
jgi:hypothetical protein